MTDPLPDALEALMQAVETKVLSMATDIESLRAQLAEVRAITPARGEKGEPGRDGTDGAPGAPGQPGMDGRDGVGLADALQDSDGRLVLVLSDGTTKALGVVRGADGAPGLPGRDGLGFEDLSVEFDGERTATLVFMRGEERKAFPLTLPTLLDRGVYQPGRSYAKGDGVTWGGSFWIAQEATDSKPGEGGSGWRLAVKKGRDGRDHGVAR